MIKLSKENKCEQSGIQFHDALDLWLKKARGIFKGKQVLILIGTKHPTLVEHYVFKFEVTCCHCSESRVFQWIVNPKGEIIINSSIPTNKNKEEKQ